MSRTLTFKIHNAKLLRSGSSLMVADVAVGYTTDDKFVGVLDIRGVWLKSKRDGSGNYIQFPSKPRRTKDGEPVRDDNGYEVYDNQVDLHMDRTSDKKGPTEAAWNFRKWLIGEMESTYKTLNSAEGGRGAARAAPAREAAAAPAARGGGRTATKPVKETAPPENDFETEGGWDDEDDLPF